MKAFLKFSAWLLLIILTTECSENELLDFPKKYPEYSNTVFKKPVPSDYTIWQVPSVMMSYIIQTRNNRIVIIDGGNENDAYILYKILKTNHFNTVTAWFLTHPHDDHVGAITRMLSDSSLKDLIIKKIYCSFPSESEIAAYEPQSLSTFLKFKESLTKSGQYVTKVNTGDIIMINHVNFEILSVNNPEIKSAYLNNSSMAIKVYDHSKSVLFTGDLSIDGGNKLLKKSRSKLKADYVQMAHHGSLGVDKSFYEAVQPKYCLWPTPRWLWNNDGGTGYNSGRFTTLITREWMQQLGVKKNYLMADGLIKIK